MVCLVFLQRLLSSGGKLLSPLRKALPAGASRWPPVGQSTNAILAIIIIDAVTIEKTGDFSCCQ